MKITILCNNASHPVNSWLKSWVDANSTAHIVELVQDKARACGGDILFLISCNQIISNDVRDRYRSTLVIHASDLPKGRGWSPHIWQIIQGANQITLSLLEAEDQVDTGRIWKKARLSIDGTWLYDEVNKALFEAELALMDFAVENLNLVVPDQQNTTIEPTYYLKRTADDSCLDPTKSIAEQFDQIRVSDPNRFPAYFDFRGQRYRLTIEKY